MGLCSIKWVNLSIIRYGNNLTTRLQLLTNHKPENAVESGLARVHW
jgi:hypothetical protein